MKDYKIVFLGTPEFASVVLQGLLDANYNVVAVVTQPDKIRGKNKIPTFSPVKEVALQHQIPVYQPFKLKNEYDFLNKIKPDLLITCAYGQILPQAVLDIATINNINVHASLLPSYRGGAPIHRCLINGDTKTGVTIMQMVQKMDAGCMYAKKEIKLDNQINTSELFSKLAVIGKELLLETLPSIIDKSNSGIKQNEDEVTYAYNILREEEKIDFTKSCKKVHNLIRGLAMNPGAYGYFKDKTLKIYKTDYTPIQKKETDICGQLKVINQHLYVCCNDGYLEIKLLQLEGKKMLEAKDFLNGQKIEMIENEILK